MQGDITSNSKQDEDTTCCICFDTYKYPIALPCTHMFCIQCLQETRLKANKGPGDEMSCPICRQIFRIPTTRVLCDACSEKNEEDEPKQIPTANTYCIDCQQRFCDECKKFHKRLKLCKHHKLVPISELNAEIGNIVDQTAPYACEQHDQRVLDVYCAECKTVICAICFIENHEGHKGSHVNKVVDQFRKELENNIDIVKACRSQAQLKQSELMKAKLDFQQKLLTLECDISTRKDVLKEIADKHAKSLLEELCSVKQKRSKDLQVEIDDFDSYMLTVESYCSYCLKIMTQGSASEICRDVSDLSVRAKQLQEESLLLFQRQFWPFHSDFFFRKSELEAFLEEIGGNMIGEITEQSDLTTTKRSKPIEELRFLKENEALKTEVKHERTRNEDLKLTIENLKVNLNRDEQTRNALVTELDQEKTCSNKNKDKLKQEQDTNKTLSACNVTLKQKLEKEKLASAKLQEVNTNLKECLNKEQIAAKTLQETIEHIKDDLDSEKMAKITLKQDLEKEKLASTKLQEVNTNLKECLNREQITAKTLQETNEHIKHDLDSEKMANVTVKQELEKEKLVSTKLQEVNTNLQECVNKKKVTLRTLQDTNDRIKRELDREKLTSKTLQGNCEKLQEDMNKGQANNRKFQSNHDKLKQSLETETKSNKTLMHSIKELKDELEMNKAVAKEYGVKIMELELKLEQEKTEKERLIEQINENQRRTTEEHERYTSDAVLVQTFRTKVGEQGRKPIYGLTILDQELFVVSRWNSQVDVYDSMKLNFVRKFELQELLAPRDIVPCKRNKCLYIMDFKGKAMWKEILKVDPNGNLLLALSSRLDCGRLSITNESNVILAVNQTGKLNEYSPNRLFIRQIDLSQDTSIRHPLHAIKLTNGHLLVSNGYFDDCVHRVCIVDEDGNIKKSYPNVKGSSHGQLHHPNYMTIDRNGFILVSDCNNSRVLLMDSDLEFKKEILTNEKHGLRRPERICLDETNGRLFVADNESHSKSTVWRDGRILVFDLGTVDK